MFSSKDFQGSLCEEKHQLWILSVIGSYENPVNCIPHSDIFGEVRCSHVVDNLRLVLGVVNVVLISTQIFLQLHYINCHF